MSGKFLTNGQWSDEPNGYLFQADVYCPGCMTEIMIARGDASPAARDMVSVEVMEQISHSAGVDFDDEYSYDSDDFPKIITNEPEGPLNCGRCGTDISDGE